MNPPQNPRSPVWHGIDRALGQICRAAGILALPLAFLLFLQWPLREWIGAYSREANDLAQVLFALYVSVAVSAATRAQAHLAADTLARRYPPAWRRRLTSLASLAVLIPWSLFLLIVIWPSAVQSVTQLEGFPETFNPGYFALKLAVVLLALLVLLQAIVDAWPRAARDP